MAKCYSCNKSIKNEDKEANICRGCGHVVCVDCAMAGGHIMGGEHSKVAPQRWQRMSMRRAKKVRVIG